jgi:hypothetical protein
MWTPLRANTARRIFRPISGTAAESVSALTLSVLVSFGVGLLKR